MHADRRNAALRASWLACTLFAAAATPVLAQADNLTDGFREIKVAPGTAESTDFMELIRPFLMIDPLQREGSPSLDLKIRKRGSGYRFHVMTGGALDDSVSGQHYRGDIIREEGDRWLLLDLWVRDICVRGRLQADSATDDCKRDEAMSSTLPATVAGLVLATHLHAADSAHAGTASPCVVSTEDMPATAGAASKAAAEATVRVWIECMAGGPIVIPKTRLAMVLERRDPKGNAPLPYYLRAKEGPFHLTIGLKREIRPSMSAEDINAAIEFIANDGFPMPGLEVSHWRVTGLTPSSHPEVRHAVLEVNDTGIVLKMEMRIFSIYGLDMRESIVPDKPTEPHAYLSFEFARPLEMTLQLEIDGFQG